MTSGLQTEDGMMLCRAQEDVADVGVPVASGTPKEPPRAQRCAGNGLPPRVGVLRSGFSPYPTREKISATGIGATADNYLYPYQWVIYTSLLVIIYKMGGTSQVSGIRRHPSDQKTGA